MTMDGPEQDRESFRAITECNDETAAFYLEAAHGDLQQAVNMFADQHKSDVAPSQRPLMNRGNTPQATHTHQTTQHRPNPPAPNRPATTATVRASNREGNLAGLGAVGRLVSGVFGIVGQSTRFMLGLTSGVVHRVLTLLLPPSWYRWLAALAAAIVRDAAHDPEHDGSALLQTLRESYGPHMLGSFEGGSWREALEVADRRSKLLLVYLHAPDHVDTARFCHRVLSHPEVQRCMETNFVCWAGSITQRDAFHMASLLRPATYPCIAIVSRTSPSSSSLGLRAMAVVEGYVEAEVLITSMTNAMEASLSAQSQQLSAQAARDSARRIREEQDMALEASKAEDLVRASARSQEKAAAAAAAAKVLAEEEAVKQAEAALQQAKVDRVAAIESRRQQKSVGLLDEPSAFPGAALIRIRLSNGAVSQRRFDGSIDTIACVYDFVDSLPDLAVWDYLLCSTFPRREFERDDCAALTLAAAGLVPNATLMVTNRDD